MNLAATSSPTPAPIPICPFSRAPNRNCTPALTPIFTPSQCM